MPHPIDQYVGARIREARHLAGVSQTTLAQAVGTTFQQVQKYENAMNRVSASRLVRIARALRQSPDFFLDDAPEGDEQIAIEGPDRTVMVLARQVREIHSPYIRKALIDTARRFADCDRFLRETVEAAVEGTPLNPGGHDGTS